jgi:hypothetical protein
MDILPFVRRHATASMDILPFVRRHATASASILSDSQQAAR